LDLHVIFFRSQVKARQEEYCVTLLENFKQPMVQSVHLYVTMGEGETYQYCGRNWFMHAMTPSAKKLVLVFGLGLVAPVAEGVPISQHTQRQSPAAVTYSAWTPERPEGEPVLHRVQYKVGDDVFDVSVDCVKGGPNIAFSSQGAKITKELRTAFHTLLLQLHAGRMDRGKLKPSGRVCDDPQFLPEATAWTIPTFYFTPFWGVTCLKVGTTVNASLTDGGSVAQTAEVLVGSIFSSGLQKIGNCFNAPDLNITRYTQNYLNYQECCARNQGTLEYMATACTDEEYVTRLDWLYGSACDIQG